MRIPVNSVIRGDCEKVLKTFPDNCIDLIVTSPPYGSRRNHVYNDVSPDKYVEWFLPKSAEFLRVLKPTGTFILNIKERTVSGERHIYVLNLIIEMRNQGWRWTEEYMWHKKNSYPGKWPNRFRDNWERLLQFNKDKIFKMIQEAVMVPMGDWAKSRLKKLSDVDKLRDESKAKSGFGKKVANWVGRQYAYPSNVLHMATECYNQNHSATFPVSLPAWFIKLFTEENDIVLDPFVGSGTTLVAAKQLKRQYIGIDLSGDFCDLARGRVNKPIKELQ
jgi:site-specific DNA-methyltransferase (adenine-specific)